MVTSGHKLPKLIANISSQFHHLVNTGLTVGFLLKWLPIKEANPSKRDKFERFIARRLKMAPSHCNHLEHTMSCEILHPIVWGTSVNPLALILKTNDLFLHCKLIFSWKATKVGSPPNFPKPISQLWGIPQPQYFITFLLDPHWTYFWKHYKYYKKDTKKTKCLATKFGFVSHW